MKSFLSFVFVLFVATIPAYAQEAKPETNMPKMSMDFMAGYGLDESQASLGFETQGRVGFVIFGLDGKIGKNFTYKMEINPVNETSPLPSCGEVGFFYPNDPRNNNGVGPNVSCDPNGRQRVDEYRFVALDPIYQQGPIRQAYVTYNNGPFRVRGGRFILPLGFRWDEVGSFHAKDATHIQRINSEAEFGLGVGVEKRLYRVEAVIFAGDTRSRDYDYFYFIDSSLDANSGLNSMVSGTVNPVRGLEVRGAWKKGFSGSKVERLPNFWASKRNDDAVIFSVKYSPVRYVTIFGEQARYAWGLTKTSAEMLGRTNTSPVKKPGYYIGVTGKYPVRKNVVVGTTITREELSRDDSLVRLFAEDGMYNVRLGKKERSLTQRFFVTMYDKVTIGAYMNKSSNPFPWLSGNAKVEGPDAFKGRGDNKWGVMVRFTQHFN